MPFAKIFCTPEFGMLRDRFGDPWMVNCDEPSELTAFSIDFHALFRLTMLAAKGQNR